MFQTFDFFIGFVPSPVLSPVFMYPLLFPYKYPNNTCYNRDNN